MRQSELFSKARKLAPADEVAKNAQLLIRAGYIHKEMAGVYSYLPLGLRVIEKIKSIVREEMNAIGGVELLMSSLQRKDVWEKTDRWDDAKVDVWFKSRLASGGEVGLGWSHEEPITEMMTEFVASYRNLPVYTYQFQTKLRNERRAKSGILRCREFLMKDLYSYTINQQAHQTFYDAAIAAYLRVFSRVGIGERTFLTYASGGAFTDFSHEFQTLSEAGEDLVYLHRAKKLAINKEVLTDEVLAKVGVKRAELEEARAIEVGNIFSFGDAKSKQLGLNYRDEKGAEHPVILGSYGLGITRLMGTLVEVFADEKGLIWPEAVAPFKYHLVSLPAGRQGLGHGGDEISKTADTLYAELEKAGVETLYDDRDLSAGAKFAESDLIGIPLRVVVGTEAAATGAFEVVQRGARAATRPASCR